MKGNKKEPIPEHFSSAKEAGEFWDTHDLTDYWDETQPTNLKFNLRRKHYYLSVVPELMLKIQQVSEGKGISIETISNLWLQEKLQAVEGKSGFI